MLTRNTENRITLKTELQRLDRLLKAIGAYSPDYEPRTLNYARSSAYNAGLEHEQLQEIAAVCGEADTSTAKGRCGKNSLVTNILRSKPLLNAVCSGQYTQIAVRDITRLSRGDCFALNTLPIDFTLARDVTCRDVYTSLVAMQEIALWDSFQYIANGCNIGDRLARVQALCMHMHSNFLRDAKHAVKHIYDIDMTVEERVVDENINFTNHIPISSLSHVEFEEWCQAVRAHCDGGDPDLVLNIHLKDDQQLCPLFHDTRFLVAWRHKITFQIKHWNGTIREKGSTLPSYISRQINALRSMADLFERPQYTPEGVYSDAFAQFDRKGHGILDKITTLYRGCIDAKDKMSLGACLIMLHGMRNGTFKGFATQYVGKKLWRQLGRLCYKALGIDGRRIKRNFLQIFQHISKNSFILSIKPYLRDIVKHINVPSGQGFSKLALLGCIGDVRPQDLVPIHRRTR